MNVEVKHDSFVSSNILAVRAPNNGNDTIDNNNNNNNIIKIYQTKLILSAIRTLIHRMSTRQVVYIDQQE